MEPEETHDPAPGPGSVFALVIIALGLFATVPDAAIIGFVVLVAVCFITAIVEPHVSTDSSDE